MAAIQSAFSILRCYPSTKSISHCHPMSLHSTKLHIFSSALKIPLNTPLYPFPVLSAENPSFQVLSTGQGEAVLEEEHEKAEKVQPNNQKRKLFVLNLPWTCTVADIKNHFGECGTVSDVEIIKQKDGKNRGFAFVTMATGEEAQAVINRFDSSELSGRIIRVEFAKRFKKRTRSPPSAPLPRETHHKIYVSNLAWKVRSNNLREFLSDFSPVSARVVFDSPSRRQAGYGFVSFATKEEAEAAISSLDGKELMGRPIRLKFSEQSVEREPESGPEEINEEQPAVL